MIDLEPIRTRSEEKYCKYEIDLSVAFEDSACLMVDLENCSKTSYLLPSAHILLGSTESTEVSFCLVDTDGSPIDVLPPNSKGNLIVAFPQFLFISSNLVRTILDCRWISSRPTKHVPGILISQLENSKHPVESYVISAPIPSYWRKLDDLNAILMQLFASVCLQSRDFSPVEPYGFREMFSKFDSCDFGEWQLLFGTEEFSGLLVGPSNRETGQLDRIYGKSDSQLDAFLQKIQPLL